MCGIKQVLVDTYDSLYSIGPTAKLLALTNSPDELIAETSKHFNVGDYNVIKGSPDPFFVEYLRPDVSKGSAVVQMCQHYGINMEQVVAFGDGDNDREMLSLAGLGVAMKNAKDAAKYAANVVLEVIWYITNVAPMVTVMILICSGLTMKMEWRNS